MPQQSLLNAYSVDCNAIRSKAYDLLALFYANREIERRANLASPTDSASMLQSTLFSTKVTHLLLEIAIHMRTLDDQFQRADSSSRLKTNYLRQKELIDSTRKGHICLFDKFGVRQVFNKIIHADLVEPHFQVGGPDHELDHQNYLGWSIAVEEDGVDYPKPSPVAWKHLSDHVRLSGEQGGKRWYSLLNVPEFIEAVYKLLDIKNNNGEQE